MSVCIISVGNELLKGKTINTNAAYIAKKLTELGYSIKRIITVPDDVNEISHEIGRAAKNFDLVLVTGGLGPTPDDVTAEGVAKGLNKKLVLNDDAVKLVKEKTSNEKVIEKICKLPEGCKVLENKKGVAPGFIIDNVVVMPGVPSEMMAVLDEFLKNIEIKEKYYERKLITSKKEEEILEILNKIVRKHKEVEIGSYPKENMVEIIISGKSKNLVDSAADELEKLLKI